jgi:hypothetical protein
LVTVVVSQFTPQMCPNNAHCRPSSATGLCRAQDVGLVFLSAMATSIAAAAEADGQTARQALGTALVTLSIATALVGVFAILIGARCGGDGGCSMVSE